LLLLLGDCLSSAALQVTVDCLLGLRLLLVAAGRADGAAAADGDDKRDSTRLDLLWQ
jgi:hypothetical protein